MLTLRTATRRQNPSVSGFCGTFPLGFFEDRDFFSFFFFKEHLTRYCTLYYTCTQQLSQRGKKKPQMVRFGTFKRSKQCEEVAETAESRREKNDEWMTAEQGFGWELKALRVSRSCCHSETRKSAKVQNFKE